MILSSSGRPYGRITVSLEGRVHIMRLKNMQKAISDSQHGVHICKPLMETIKRSPPFVNTRGRQTSKKMFFVFCPSIAAGTTLVSPKAPMSHHLTTTKKATNMFCHPKPIESRKIRGSSIKSFPINVPESGCREAMAIVQVLLKGVTVNPKLK